MKFSERTKGMSAVLKAVIFDFNGVIVDDEPLHLELFRRVLGEEGIHLTDEEYHEKYLGFDDRGALTHSFRDNQRHADADNAAFIEQLIERKAGYYLEEIEKRWLLFPGVVELVRRISAKYPLAIASGALRHEIDFVLRRADIRNCFRVIVAAEDVSVCKPNPEGYVKALRLLNESLTEEIAPHECLVIEDSIAGIEAAKQAGMRCVAVTNSYAVSELKTADAVIHTLESFDLENAWL
jgi:HAD superfamily hydrolase (TIGR01509 family)